MPQIQNTNAGIGGFCAFMSSCKESAFWGSGAIDWVLQGLMGIPGDDPLCSCAPAAPNQPVSINLLGLEKHRTPVKPTSAATDNYFHPDFWWIWILMWVFGFLLFSIYRSLASNRLDVYVPEPRKRKPRKKPSTFWWDLSVLFIKLVIWLLTCWRDSQFECDCESDDW